ncbi:hypothetical protein HFO56_23930 [Rhizobium laguerreae]|uniref:hypothetical protein n=1 Tax=Rhizobium laguerreae TaxID=1076926 RepID=UPI001C9253AF|nr:hypothetical protein [Rhizobium laguerreae]MBY3155378.1 hypothetical protein [Rhizobium laguerreae]
MFLAFAIVPTQPEPVIECSRGMGDRALRDEDEVMVEVEKRRGGWFAKDEAKGWSGPWKTEEAAKAAAEERYADARLLDSQMRTK